MEVERHLFCHILSHEYKAVHRTFGVRITPKSTVQDLMEKTMREGRVTNIPLVDLSLWKLLKPTKSNVDYSPMFQSDSMDVELLAAI